MDSNDCRIFLANDLSDSSDLAKKIVDQVENCAQSFSRIFDSQIGYIFVSGMSSLDVNQPERIVAKSRGKIEARLSHFKVKPDVLLRFGSTADEIIRVVSANPSTELLVIGTKGRTGLEHVWEGSVAEDVIRHSPRPVVVIGPKVKGTGELPAKLRIVVATDFGGPAESAENFAIKVAKSTGAELKFLFCLGDEMRSIQESVFNSETIPYDFDASEKELKAQAEQDFAKKVAEIKKVGVAAKTEIQHGLSVDELPKISKTCDLLVMGTRGRNRLLSAFFGSTARSAMLSSEVPVLIVPPGVKT